MRYTDALAHFKTVKRIAEKCGVSVQAVYAWEKTGVVPRTRAYELRVKSGGKLKVEESLYARPAENPPRPCP